MSNFLFAFKCAWDFFLSYSFVMFRIDFLLSIWVNLHIYIDIVMFGFWVEISTIIIFLYCTWQIKHFGEKSKLQPMSSSPRNDKFLFGMLYINLLNLVWFWSRIWGFYKFWSFNSWGFWYLHISRLIFFFFFFRILSILTHTHTHKRREVKVLKKLTVVYIQKGQ